MKIKDGFAMRNIAGNNVVVPIGKTSLEFNGMITLNDSGAFLWNCFLSETNIDDAVKKLLSEYDVTEETAKKDVLNFVETLKENNILEN